QPHAFAIAPDGTVCFLRSGPRSRVHSLWAFDPRTGGERELLTAAQLLGGGAEQLSPEERARRERLRQSARGISSFELSRDGRRLLVPLSGRLFVCERGAAGAWGAPRELAPGGPPAEDAHFSPDGARVACVRDGGLRVTAFAGGAERTLAARENANVTWGSPEFVAQEEMDRFAGYWWSPDSRTLLVQRTDVSGLERLGIMDPSNPTAPPQENPYPRPGKANADVRLALIPAAGGPRREVAWDRTRYPYLCRVEWPDHGPLTLYVMDRRQQEAALLAVDVATGATRTLLTERDPAWLDLPQGVPHWLADGRTFLWIAERDDQGPALERRTPDGGAERLTPAGLRVHALTAVDEARGAAWVTASDDPREHHLWRVDLRSGGARRATPEAGLEDATFARDGGERVRTLDPATGARRCVVEDADGRALGALRDLAESPPYEPRVEYVDVGPDSLHAFVVRPRDFDPHRRYPVVDWAYGGPTALRVQRAARHYLLEQWLADHGFIVVTVDGRGTPWRGRAWERAIRGDFIGPVLADHVAGLRALCARFPEMDPRRIGVTGWSFGGFYTVVAVTRAPDVYAAGVAGAPVTDWHDYDTFYTERYLGVPPADSAAYARSSALAEAASLSRPLLVIHGTADDNVYFTHSLKLADVLDRANRPFDYLPLPGQTHVVVEAAEVRQVYERLADYLVRALGPPGDAAPPRE
ncbi:MAG TPA: prolyl oligopeptidase family serine peptidase, partial [Candidatus Eisenbacteria bacterium]|nr:prolyl oligopeptidase family serine peptidase [Candidatus Eisenbacteria bacterium]